MRRFVKEAITNSKNSKDRQRILGKKTSTFILFDKELHQHLISLKALDGLSEKPLNLNKKKKSWLLV